PAFGAWITAALVADMNRDSYPDLLFASQVSQGDQATLSLLLGNLSGVFDPAITLPYTASSNRAYPGLAVEDLNADGWPDCVASGAVQMLLWLGGPGGQL